MTQLADITLPDNYYWADEFTDWEPVQQRTEPTLTGALIVEEDKLLAGRPITLEGLWLDRADVEALDALSAVPSGKYTLTLSDGSTRQVMFRRGSGRSVHARPVFPRAPGAPVTQYITTLRLMEI